ncbi:MAG: site-specific DNA-methyltransferase, partial [Clostridia bacterium]
FLIPTRTVWDRVYRPLGFGRRYDDLRNDYELLRNYHRCDPAHNNVWRRGQMQRAEKHTGHPCEKPVDLLRRIVRVSCPPGGTVLDCFMGSGSTGVAAIKEGRDFIGIEKDEKYFKLACDWICREQASLNEGALAHVCGQARMTEIIDANGGAVHTPYRSVLTTFPKHDSIVTEQGYLGIENMASADN